MQKDDISIQSKLKQTTKTKLMLEKSRRLDYTTQSGFKSAVK